MDGTKYTFIPHLVLNCFLKRCTGCYSDYIGRLILLLYWYRMLFSCYNFLGSVDFDTIKITKLSVTLCYKEIVQKPQVNNKVVFLGNIRVR